MTLFDWFIEHPGVTNKQLAGFLGVSEEYARLLRFGRRNLSPLYARKLELFTGGMVTPADVKTAYLPPQAWKALPATHVRKQFKHWKQNV